VALVSLEDRIRVAVDPAIGPVVARDPRVIAGEHGAGDRLAEHLGPAARAEDHRLSVVARREERVAFDAIPVVLDAHGHVRECRRGRPGLAASETPA
jgi:hypothetical protein